MSSVRLTSLATFLRDAGLQVVEEPGWKARGNPLPGMPDTIVVHHTATSDRAPGDLPTRRLLIEGRSDLPGPLCQIALSRAGVVHLVSSGKANHAGKGVWKGQSSSGYTVGVEAENDGSGRPWPVKQLDAYERLCAALCRYLNVGADRVCGHREWALPRGRKTDPAGIDMDAFRDRVRSHLTSQEGDDDMTPEQARKQDEIHQMLTQLTAPRRADKSDADPKHLSLADVYTLVEKVLTK